MLHEIIGRDVLQLLLAFGFRQQFVVVGPGLAAPPEFVEVRAVSVLILVVEEAAADLAGVAGKEERGVVVELPAIGRGLVEVVKV